jgi:hypothetical protein
MSFSEELANVDFSDMSEEYKKQQKTKKSPAPKLKAVSSSASKLGDPTRDDDDFPKSSNIPDKMDKERLAACGVPVTVLEVDTYNHEGKDLWRIKVQVCLDHPNAQDGKPWNEDGIYSALFEMKNEDRNAVMEWLGDRTPYSYAVVVALPSKKGSPLITFKKFKA